MHFRMDWRSVNFDWNRARAFLVTAEEGSLTAAARALGMAQPTLGRQVTALEQELGVALFERVGRGLSLTPGGLELVEHVRAVILATHPRSIAALQRAMAVREDMTARLREIELPTLVVCGADDQISPPSEMREMAAALPRATYVEIDGAGHLPPLEQPSATTAAIQQFLQ